MPRASSRSFPKRGRSTSALETRSAHGTASIPLLPGPRVVTFNNILKHRAVPLTETIRKLLEIGKEGLGCAVEIEFACDIVKQYQINCDVRPTTSDQFPRPADRPKFSIMDLGCYTHATGHTPRSWQDALAEYVRCDPA